MDITSSSNKITITGNIKSVVDFKKIKDLTDSVAKQHTHIILDIVDSLSITSSVVGYFNKLIQKDGVDIHMNVGNEQLLNLIDDLSLTSIFKAKKA